MTNPSPRADYPLLSRIDAACEDPTASFARDPQAAALERYARLLVDELWPEHVWLSGLIAPKLLDATVRRLEAERAQLRSRILLIVEQHRATEAPSGAIPPASH